MNIWRSAIPSVCVILLAAVSTVAPVRAEWEHFDNNGDIRALYERGDTLWVGTNGGLVLVDLLAERVAAKITAGPHLADNSIRVIGARGDSVFVGSDGGLSVFAPGRVTLHTPTNRRAFRNLRCLAFSPDGKIFAGTFGDGVNVFSGRSYERITREDSLLDNKVYAIAVRDTHQVYYATSLGLCAYRDTVWVSYQAGAGLPRGEVVDLQPLGTDRYYALIRGRGIYRFNVEQERSVRIRTADIFPEDDVAAIAVDRDGALWAAGRFGGIAHLAGGQWQPLELPDDELAATPWRSAHAGWDGSIFFGSTRGTIVIVKDGEVRKISIPSTLPSDYVGPMAEDTEGRRYLANGPYLLSTNGGSSVFELETRVGAVFAMAESPAGDIWLSCPWGLLRRQGNGWVEVRPEIEPKPPLFVALTFEPSGVLWAGSHGGQVYRYDGSLWVPFAGRDAIGGEPVSAIFIDSRRDVWAVSARTGLHRFDGARWVTFGISHFDSLRIIEGGTDAAGTPVALTESSVWRYVDGENRWERQALPTEERRGAYRTFRFDAAGRLYIGTTDGLIVVGEGGYRSMGVRDGLGGRDVSSLLIDSAKELWVGFRGDGLARISLESLW